MLSRPALVQALDRWVPLTVVRGPAGFGKSTLLHEWETRAGAQGIRAVWCYAGANGPQDGVCNAVLSALAASSPSATLGPGTHLDQDEAFQEARRLVGGLQSRTALILDCPDMLHVHEPFSRLLMLARGQERFRILVTTRARQGAEALAALTQDATVIAPEDLALDISEIVELARLRGADVTALDAQLIAREVGGCPLVVDAVVTRIAQRPEGSRKDVVKAASSVDEGVWAHVLRDMVSQADIDLLAVLGLAESLTPDAAVFLSGDRDIEQKLKDLERRGALSSGTDEHAVTAYRLPTAIHRMADRYAGVEIDLDQRSSALARHLLEHGQPEQAVRQALVRPDWSLIAEIFEHSWLELSASGDSRVLRALVGLPDKVLDEYPKTRALHWIVTGSRISASDLRIPLTRSALELRQMARLVGLSNIIELATLETILLRRSGRFSDALAMARAVDGFCDLTDEGNPGQLRRLVPRVRHELAMTAMLAGDFSAASEQLSEALSGLEGLPREQAHQPALVRGLQALKSATRGDTTCAEAWIARERESERWAPPIWPVPGDGSAAKIAEAIVAIDRLDRRGAGAVLDSLRAQSRRDELWGFTAWAQARLGLLWGDRRGALRNLDRFRRLHQHLESDDGFVRPLLLAAEADLLLADGRGNHVAALLAGAPAHPFLSVVRARFALGIGDFEAAMVETLKVISDEDVLDRVYLDALLIRASTVAKAQGIAPSVRWWKDALAAAARLGAPIAPFAMVDAHLLARVETHVSGVAATRRALSARGVGLVFPAQVEVILLTPREKSVLEGLAEGASIPNIARSHYLSVNTVKSQLRALYGKLGAHSRDEAVAVAFDAGLISSKVRGCRQSASVATRRDSDRPSRPES